MAKKFYKFCIEERNGEQEYSYPMGCWANTENGAIKKARSYAKQFYDNYDGKPKETEPNVFYFDSAGIEVELDFSGEYDFEEFKREIVSRATIQ
jgi:endoglucanase Acf2